MKLEIEVQSQIEFRQLFYSLLVSHLGFTDEGIKIWVSRWLIEKPDEFDPGTWIYTPEYKSARVFYSGSEYYWFPANDNEGLINFAPNTPESPIEPSVLGMLPRVYVTGYWQILDLPDPTEWSTEPVLFTAFIVDLFEHPLEGNPELFFDTQGHLKCYVYGFETGMHFIFRNSRNEAYYFSFIKAVSPGQYFSPNLLTMVAVEDFEAESYFPDNPWPGIYRINGSDPYSILYKPDSFGYFLFPVDEVFSKYSPISYLNPNFQEYFSGSLFEMYKDNSIIGAVPCICGFSPSSGAFVNFSVFNNIMVVEYFDTGSTVSYLGFYE